MASLALAFDILARDRASREFEKVGDAADRAGEKGAKFGKAVGAGVAIAAAAVGKLAVDAVKSASAQEQALGGVASVFGKAATAVEDYADRAAQGLGLAKTEYASLAAVVGSQLQRLGQSQAESAQSTDKLITLGADLAATFGGSVSDAVSAVGSLLRGERDPIERYGVGINDAAIKAELLKQGLGNLTGAALDQAKGQATLKLLTEQTANAQGAAKREAGTLEGQTIRLSAEYKNLSSQVGTILLPIVTGAIEKFKALAGFIKDNRDIVVPLVTILGGLAAAVVAVNTAVRIYTATQAALNVVLAANPIGLVITAIALLAAGLIVAYKNSETFRNIVVSVFQVVARTVVAAVDGILFVIEKVFQVLAKIPGPFQSTFRKAADAVGQARAGIDALQRSIENLKSKDIVISTTYRTLVVGSAPGSGGSFSAQADGGPVSAGRPYLVGEKGPEMIVPRSSGTVLTADQTASLGRSGGATLSDVVAAIRELPSEQQRRLRMGMAY